MGHTRSRCQNIPRGIQRCPSRSVLACSTSRTTKRTREEKEAFIEDVRTAVDAFERVYVFRVSNMRNKAMKETRVAWKGSRFFFGKNKLMRMALGTDAATAVVDGIEDLSNKIVGTVGLLFTNEPHDSVLEYFESFDVADFARQGSEATHDVTLEAGHLTQFATSIEPHLRSLGLPTKVDNGRVMLEFDVAVCKEGDSLTSEQARILKLFEMKLARMKFFVDCCFSISGGFEDLYAGGEASTSTA